MARLAVVLLALALMLVCGRVIIEQRRRAVAFDHGQVLRFVSLGLGMWYVAGTELAVFGTPATPRLILGIAVAGTGLYGMHKVREQQRHDPPVR